MRQRTNAKFTDSELAIVYNGYDSSQWMNHRFRVDLSASIINRMIDEWPIESVADLAVGDGRIIGQLLEVHRVVYDIAEANIDNLSIECEKTVADIDTSSVEMPEVDLVILSEILEHIENPDQILKNVRSKTKYIFISTPLNEGIHVNPQHYWVWDDEGVGKMIEEAGFHKLAYLTFQFFPEQALYQIWVAV